MLVESLTRLNISVCRCFELGVLRAQRSGGKKYASIFSDAGILFACRLESRETISKRQGISHISG